MVFRKFEIFSEISAELVGLLIAALEEGTKGPIPRMELESSLLLFPELLLLEFVELRTKEDLPKDSSCAMVELMHLWLLQMDPASMKNMLAVECSFGLQIS